MEQTRGRGGDAWSHLELLDRALQRLVVRVDLPGERRVVGLGTAVHALIRGGVGGEEGGAVGHEGPEEVELRVEGEEREEVAEEAGRLGQVELQDRVGE